MSDSNAYRRQLVFISFLGAILAVLWICGCRDSGSAGSQPASSSHHGDATGIQGQPRVGVLLVSQGSHSAEWRKMLQDFHESVEPQILALPGINGVKSAFMEYTEPSIASQLRAFDQEGYGDVILVPLLLTVSSHSFDDIPTIIGAQEDAKSMLTLQSERIERYVPRARVTITPLLDFSSLLEKNLPRRIAALSKEPAREGVLLVAYGDRTYDDEWEDFFARLDQVVQTKTGVAEVRHCWCGHIVHYSKQPTQAAIRQILARVDRAIVIPVLVARDEFFQERVIGKAIVELNVAHRIAYMADSILPDPTLNEWVVATARETLARLFGAENPDRGHSP